MDGYTRLVSSRFKSWGLSFTTPTKRNFYIPKFIIQTITQKFPTKTNLNDLSFFAWENHLLPPFIKGLEYPKNEYYNDFTKLDDKQKSLIAFFLCHRFEEKQIIFDKPDKTQKTFFYEYWLPYLKVLFSDINLFDSDNMDWSLTLKPKNKAKNKGNGGWDDRFGEKLESRCGQYGDTGLPKTGRGLLATKPSECDGRRCVGYQ